MALSTIEKLRQGAGTFFGSFWNNCAASKIKSAGGLFEAETATSPSQKGSLAAFIGASPPSLPGRFRLAARPIFTGSFREDDRDRCGRCFGRRRQSISLIKCPTVLDHDVLTFDKARRKRMSQPEQFEVLVLGSGTGGKLVAWHMAQSGRLLALADEVIE
jgi:hypothetical protein